MQNYLSFIQNISINQNHLKAGLIAILLFALFLTVAAIRKYFVKSTLDGVGLGIFFGFILAIIIEGFLLIAGKTLFTEMLGWNEAPKPISTAVDLGREKLIDVLGVSDGLVEDSSLDRFITSYQSLNPDDQSKFKKILCSP